MRAAPGAALRPPRRVARRSGAGARIVRLAILLVAGSALATTAPRNQDVGRAALTTARACAGDCDTGGTVTVEELVRGVEIALGVATLDQCAAFDCHGDGRVTVDCLVRAVDAALNGCGELPIIPVTSCASLAQLSMPDTAIAEVALVAAAVLPEHCVVRGEIAARTGVTNPDTGSNAYGTKFELRLPTAWNGRFFYQGGFGTDGVVLQAAGTLVGAIETPALQQGFAVVSSNGGHESSSLQAGFGVDPQARIDVGYRSIGQVTPVAKSLIATYYGEPPHHSYFFGCSKGGQEAMQASQRYGDLFDGVVAGDPGFNLPRAALAEAWDTQAFAAAARALSPGSVDAHGDPLLYTSFSQSALRLVTDAVLQACDSLDGLQDHMIFNVAACEGEFDPAALQCSGAPDDSCLAPVQVATLRTVFAGAMDSQGSALYPDWPYDSGIGSPGWATWKIGLPTAAPVNTALNVTLGLSASRYLFATPPDPSLRQFTVDIDAFARAITATGTDPNTGVEYAASSVDFMTADSTALDAFKNHGGKLILYHGVSDAVFSMNDTVRYYDALSVAYGGSTPGFARLFLVQGMNHCFGGDYAVDRFDTLAPIVRWVEEGQAPDALQATPLSPSASLLPAGIRRPLCAYPGYAHYDGAGDVNSAASFRCVAPTPRTVARASQRLPDR